MNIQRLMMSDVLCH